VLLRLGVQDGCRGGYEVTVCGFYPERERGPRFTVVKVHIVNGNVLTTVLLGLIGSMTSPLLKPEGLLLLRASSIL
jgi:hypothetical protein